jgi:hypothetical protein
MSFARAKKLILEYYSLKQGDLIVKHEELLGLFYFDNKMVYISRRALKHFVERRKEELAKRHSKKRSLKIISFAIRHIQEVVAGRNFHETTAGGSSSYMKDYSSEGMPLLRILIQEKDGHFEIQSIHFKRGRKSIR